MRSYLIDELSFLERDNLNSFLKFCFRALVCRADPRDPAVY